MLRASLQRIAVRGNAYMLLSRSFLVASRASRQVRLNSTAPPPLGREETAAEKAARRAALEHMDDLQRDWDATVIEYQDLKPKTSNPTADTYLIDVREPDEVVQGMIPSAVNLPLSGLSVSLRLNPSEFREKHGFEMPKQDQEVIFYCRSGKRSASASDIAKRNGYTNILNYRGSWLEWIEKENKKEDLEEPTVR